MHLAAQYGVAQTLGIALAYVVDFAQVVGVFNALEQGVLTLVSELLF